MAITGRIADEARDALPVTWDALLTDRRYGESALQRRINSVQSKVFGAILSDSQEAGLDPLVVEYIGKLVAISIIPAGADFWATQKIQDNSGERVSAVWVDRAEKLWELHAQLVAETRSMQPDIEVILGTGWRTARRRRPGIGVSQPSNAGMVTQNPFDFDREAVDPTATAVV